MSLLDDWLKTDPPDRSADATGNDQQASSSVTDRDGGRQDEDDDPMGVDSSLPADLQLPDLGLSDLKWWVDLEFLDLASGPPANITSGNDKTNRNMKTPTFE